MCSDIPRDRGVATLFLPPAKKRNRTAVVRKDEPFFQGFAPSEESDWEKDYKRYLASKRWGIIALATRLLADNRCQLELEGCTGFAQQTHHTKEGYKHLRREVPGVHVIACCGNCHMRLHSIEPDNDNQPPSAQSKVG